MNKIIAALIAATFSLGAFAQAATAPAPTNNTQPTASSQDNAAGNKAESKAEKKAVKKKAKKAKAKKASAT